MFLAELMNLKDSEIRQRTYDLITSLRLIVDVSADSDLNETQLTIKTAIDQIVKPKIYYEQAKIQLLDTRLSALPIATTESTDRARQCPE